MRKNHSRQIVLRSICSIVAATVFVLMCLSPGWSSELQKVDLYALIVGIKKYKNPKFNRLSIQGTTDFYDFLVERRRLFSDVHVALLTDEQATKANIEHVWKNELARARKDDIVMIFLDGHGGFHPATPGHYYFYPYDADYNLPRSGVRVSDRNLFASIRSERLLLMTGACFSGGFLAGLARGRAIGASFDFFQDLNGRFGISAARNDEVAKVPGKFGMNLFTFYLTKGLRGAASTPDGKITIRSLYDYVSDNVVRDTNGTQHPQLFYSKGEPEKTTIYAATSYQKRLEVNVKFFCEADDNQVKPLTDATVLKSGQHVGVAFKPNSDCYVHILWWDSSGRVGRMFPNPQLTEGTGEAKAGQTYWLPSRGERQWYVLDDKPGYETVYFVASRERNPKLEELYDQLKALSAKAKTGAQGTKVAQQIEREINLMGFAEYTVPVKNQQTFENKEKLFEEMESKIKVAGAEGFFKLRFKHTPR